MPELVGVPRGYPRPLARTTYRVIVRSYGIAVTGPSSRSRPPPVALAGRHVRLSDRPESFISLGHGLTRAEQVRDRRPVHERPKYLLSLQAEEDESVPAAISRLMVRRPVRPNVV